MKPADSMGAMAHTNAGETTGSTPTPHPPQGHPQ